MPTSSPSRPPPEASPYAKHIPALDGIRGIAVLAVISSHLFPGTPRTPLTQAVERLLAFGATGVDLFFVLSGFLITGILYDSLKEPHFFRKFYARRVLRIFPLYYGVLALYALGTLFFDMHYSNELWSMALYLQNTNLIAPPIYTYPGPSFLPLAHFWSLAIEEQFYLVWPLVVFSLRDRRKLLLICLLFTVLCPVLRALLWQYGAGYYPVHTNTVLRADSLLAGGALALLLRSRGHDQVLRLASWLLPMGLLILTLVDAVPMLYPAAQALWPATRLSLRYTGADLLYVALITLALRPGIVAALCHVRPLRALGKYSYGLYVIHLPLFDYLKSPIRNLIAAHLTHNKGVGVMLTGLICFLLSVLAAVASYLLYERHFLRLKRYFSYRGSATPVSIVS